VQISQYYYQYIIGYRCHIMTINLSGLSEQTLFVIVPASSIGIVVVVMRLGAVAVRVRVPVWSCFRTENHLSLH
jgi:hypothetical protein